MNVRPVIVIACCAGAVACAGHPSSGSGSRPTPQSRPAQTTGAPPSTPPAAPADASPGRPAVPPQVAYLAGLMPLRSTGVDNFRLAHPTYDGRGVLIAILDTGVDPGVAGLIVTSTGAPKVLDLRDFSGEGRVALTPVAPDGDRITIGARTLAGAGRIARLSVGASWYAGVLRELPLGKAPAGDLNGNGNNTDEIPVVVVKASDGWVVFFDSNLNGSFEDEMPLHDYRQGRETIALGTKPVTLAANFSEAAGAPVLDVIFDTGGHGTHVAGIATGHNLFDIEGFDGVAPGAQLIGLKIANNARGGISVNGSMARALDYAARFASDRGLPLVVNMSFGVGNEIEGHASIDSVIDVFLAQHPEIVFTIAAGNDGPGLSTLGFPGSADLALSVGALLPGSFAKPTGPGDVPGPDFVGDWSSRGGELAKPDIVTPGVAFSSVPHWNIGGEIKGGTSMAAPAAAGLAARLISAMTQEGRRPSAADVMQALRATAAPFGGWSPLDQGAGVPRIEAAYRWLAAGHQGASYRIRTSAGASAAFRRAGLSGPGDTITVFHVTHVAGFRAAHFELKSDAVWLQVPAAVTEDSRGTGIALTYRAPYFEAPGVYTGTVTARNPSDTLAGPLFTLVNTVVVPYNLARQPLVDSARVIGPGRLRRYFLSVPSAGVTLALEVRLRDTTQRAMVKLYEPNGQPFRGGGELALGGDAGSVASAVVRAEDAVPGVYEMDVVAPAQNGVTVSVRAAVAPVALAGESRAVEMTDASPATAAGTMAFAVTGAERDTDITGRGLPAESITVRAPAWGTSAEVDVEMPREQWDRFTDFGVTIFDSIGQQVALGPLNYAVGRLAFDVPVELRGTPLTIELFPALAVTATAVPWHATVRARFLLPAARPIDGSKSVSVVAGARQAVPVGAVNAPAVPDGFRPLVEARFTPTDGATAVIRLPVESP